MTDGGAAPIYRGNLDKLLEYIHEAGGIDLWSYRRPYLERRVAARMRALNLSSYRQYRDLLEADASEYQRLMDTVTINVTEFFRDKPVWDQIKRTVFRPMVEEKAKGRSRSIRIWSAGCATGEEPYSLAMSLLDTLGDDRDRFLVSVWATDLDPKALATAEAAVYPNERLKRIPPSYQVRFTQSAGPGSFQIAPDVKRIVRFSRSSLFEPTPMRVVDLIVCRNVFIYFDREQQAKVLENFQLSLARGGYLVLGRSEKLSVDAAAALDVVDGKERIYRKPNRL